MNNLDNTASTNDSLRSLLNTALQQPAHIGARIVSLWWLHRLHRARNRWHESVSANAAHAESEAADALHDARVETRRLRGALRHYRTLLSGSARQRDAANLRALNRVMSEARDADVASAWLAAEAEMLPDDARREALLLRDALLNEARNNSRRINRAFRKHFDAYTAALRDSLSSYRVEGVVGLDPLPAYFANALSATLDRVTRCLYKALAKSSSVADADELHRVRRMLKQVRDLLVPFISQIPEISALYDTATRAQDTLGAMRDAQLLAERARNEEFWALATELDNVSLAHYNAFAMEWKRDGDIAIVAQLEAIQNALLVSHELVSEQPVNADGAPLEIERKYLLRGCPPEAALAPAIRIEQGWLPGTTLRERLRRSTYPTGVSRFTRTVKFGGGLSRIELQEDTERPLFDALWPLTAARRVYKRRHAIREDGYTWEIDVFTDRDLVLAEVELKSEGERPELPKWLSHWVIREVTGERDFFNAHLARPETHEPPPVAELQSL
ncbi:MAG: CHAD domain-containing protein [Gemmatimonadaceae bacterium]